MDYRLPLNLENTWESAENTKRILLEYISATLEESEIFDRALFEGDGKAYLEGLAESIKKNITKPKVIIAGRSGVGKSTLTNALLGADVMPTAGAVPTTSIAVYIKHIDDKPAFMEEDVWVFADSVDADGEDGGYFWDESRLYDESYCRMWRIGAGGTEVLKSFGTRQGAHYSGNVGAAVVFLDADILKVCDIVDGPGYDTKKNDDMSEDIDIYFYEVVRDTDIVVFLSPADRFMSEEDISYLERLVVRFPCIKREDEDFSNLFLVAAQMDPVNPENAAQLEEKFDAGCADLMEALQNPQNAWGRLLQLYNFSNKGFQRLRARFFTYTTDIPDMCLPFYTALAETLETVPESIIEHTKRNLQWQIEGYREYVTREIQNAADDSSTELVRQRVSILNRLLDFFENTSL